MRFAVLRLLIAFALTAAAGVGQGDSSNLRRGEWRDKDVPEGYFIVREGRYQLQSNWDRDKVERAARHMAALFNVYREMLPAKKTPTGELVVKIFKTRRDFLGYGASPTAAGYYDTVNDEMVGYDTGEFDGISTLPGTTESGKPKGWRERLRAASAMDVLGVFSHEGWHQYFHWACTSQIPFPAWLDEGIGDYYYTAHMVDREIVLGAPNDTRLGTIQNAITKGSYVAFGDFVYYDQQRYYADAGQNYAQGWAMVHFFLEHPLHRERKYVQRYLRIFLDQHSMEKTVPRVFGKKPDWESIEKDWKDWVMAMPQEIDEDDPFVERAREANEAAAKRRAELPESVRKALENCIARRRAP